MAVFWILGIATGSILHGPHGALRPHTIATPLSLAGHWWALAAAGFWSRNLTGYVLGTILVALVGTPVERRLGSVRFAVAALATQAIGIVAATAFSWSVRGLMGSWFSVLITHTYLGPSALICGATMAATATLGTLWRRRLRLAAMALLALLALYSGSFEDLVRLGAAGGGTLLGPLLAGHRPRLKFPSSSRREARVLVSLIVATSAVGPVLAGLLPHAVGPLAVLRFLFTNIQPVDPSHLQALCTDPALARDCAGAQLQLRAGAGGLFMAILPSFLLLLFAEGMRRGRRFAWVAALLLEGVMATLAGTYIAGILLPAAPGSTPNEGAGAINLTEFHHPLSLVLPLLLPVLVVVLLLATYRLFKVSAPPKTYPGLLVRILATGAVLAGVYAGAGLLLSGGFTPPPGLAQLVADIPDRFLPLGYLLDVPPAFFPQSTAAVVLYEGTGVVFWAVTAVFVWKSFLRPAHHRHGADEDHARAILRAQESSPLSWMTMWAGNTYWFSSKGTGFVAFRVLSGIALSLGVPVGPKSELRACVEEFSRFAVGNGWTPCFYSVTADVKDITTSLGWGSVQVAQETILSLDSVTFKGKKYQDVRTAVNKAATEGIRAEWLVYPTAPLAIVDQIQAISEEWVADRRMPEMGFTLGGLDEINDPEVRCLVALDRHGTVHAVTSWLPVYRNGSVVGWTLDFMRRRGTGFRASIEFLIASAALSLKDDGFEFISLSGAPLARTGPHVPSPLDQGVPAPATGAMDRVLDWLGATLEPVYGFRSLLAFKAKFQPRYETLFMAYPDAAALPSIANAIARAYLPQFTFRQGLYLARKITRRPLRAGRPRAPAGSPQQSPANHWGT
ncbi:bifunctional lysylphosphatidylglycerol flippase/synthetase MprF [Pseudarthrobacter sp. P1]|uniref:bifunctional lysylphosphatidylglycerol flippase/synthetase MprF n=1 Tax=Pseudarthrobacter sp. P1 TaxID=3418418 RepID=UPI003CF454A7